MKPADFTAPAIAAAVFAVFAALYFWAPSAYHFVLTWWGIAPFQSPFLDTGAIITAIECVRYGVDVYVANPCDMLGRPHVYSPVWLAASVLPVTGAWTMPAGLTLDLAFLLSLAAIPFPVGRRDRWMLVVAVLSTTSVYAVERANNDLAIFVLLVFAAVLFAWPFKPGSLALRRCAYPLVVLAALLKFYPAAALVITFRERGRDFLIIAALSLAGFFIAVALAGPDLARAIAIIPTGSYFTDAFGARNLPYGIAELLYGPSWQPIIDLLPLMLFAVLGLRALWIVAALARRPALAEALAEMPERLKLLLIIGAAIVTGCFFTAHNVGYRGIFLIMILPGLLVLARQADGDDSGRLCSNTAKLVLFVMWSEALRHAIYAVRPFDLPGWHTFEAAFWIARELIWWRIVAVLGGVLLRFVLASAVWCGLSPAKGLPRTPAATPDMRPAQQPLSS